MAGRGGKGERVAGRGGRERGWRGEEEYREEKGWTGKVTTKPVTNYTSYIEKIYLNKLEGLAATVDQASIGVEQHWFTRPGTKSLGAEKHLFTRPVIETFGHRIYQLRISNASIQSHAFSIPGN